MVKKVLFNPLRMLGSTGLLAAVILLSACGDHGGDAGEAQDSANTIVEDGVGLVEVVESGNDGEVAADGPVGVISIENDAHEFGKVTEGTVVEHIYTFTNTGDAPVILSQVSASCGCTTPEYSRTPIAPGQQGSIKVVFDSNGQVGQQHKIISVLSNASVKVVLLHLRGEVTPKA